MRKMITFLATVMLLAGCGDETTVKGYTDEDVQNMFAVFKDSVVQGVFDSVTKEIGDAIYLSTRDTIYAIAKSDSIAIVSKVDTIYNVIRDTSLIRIVDSLYSQYSSDSNEVPRDTSITLYDTTVSESGNTIVSRTWKGKVYGGFFYDTVGYQEFRGSSYASDKYCASRCGAINEPDWASLSCWNSYEKMNQRFDGWRLLTTEDVFILGDKLGSILGTNTVNVAYFRAANANESSFFIAINSTREIIKGEARDKYMCVYKLSDK